MPIKPTTVAVCLLTFIGLWHLSTIRTGHEWGDDFSLYILHAKNLVEGRPYAETGYIYNPDAPISPRSYPPGFPMLLAPVYARWGLNLTAMKVELIGCFLVALTAIFVACRRFLSEWEALALVATVGLNPFFWSFKDQVLSDIPFLLVTYIALSFAARLDDPRPHERVSVRIVALASVALLVASAIRTVGLVLLPTLLLTDLLHAKRLRHRTMLVCAPTLCAAVWCLATAKTRGGYIHQWHAHLLLVLANVNSSTKELRDLWHNGYAKALMRAMFLAVNGLGFVGYYWNVRKGASVFEVFAWCYVAVVALWPQYQGIRLLIPVIPLYVAYAIIGLRTLRSWRLFAWLPRRSPAWLFGIVLVSYGARYTTMDYGPIREGIAQPATVELFEYVTYHTSPDSVCLFIKPRALALFTGRRASVYAPAGDEELLRYCTRIGARYVIATRLFEQDRAVLQPFLARHPDRFEQEYTNRDFTVYRVKEASYFKTSAKNAVISSQDWRSASAL